MEDSPDHAPRFLTSRPRALAVLCSDPFRDGVSKSPSGAQRRKLVPAARTQLFSPGLCCRWKLLVEIEVKFQDIDPGLT
jgi:hypothetical protein